MCACVAPTHAQKIQPSPQQKTPTKNNPKKAFLTAVMQTYARARGLPLDVMRFMTDVTSKVGPEAVGAEPAPVGAYVHGLFLEGAR